VRGEEQAAREKQEEQGSHGWGSVALGPGRFYLPA
jgi:hypothetical protein